MNPEALNHLVRAVPFRPFRITMVNGRTFDIRHPEMIHVTRRECYLFVHEENEDPMDARIYHIGPSVILYATHIDTPAPAQPQDTAA